MASADEGRFFSKGAAVATSSSSTRRGAENEIFMRYSEEETFMRYSF